MDTILFFYKKRGLQAPEPEPVGLKSYMLVRVAMDVGEEEWFGEKLRLPEEKAWGEAGNGSCAEACAGNAVLPRKKTDPFWGIAAGDMAAQGPGKGRGFETERGRGWGRTA